MLLDNNSSDNTSVIALERKVRLIQVKEIGYEKTISIALKNVKDLEYTQFLIVDGDNEIDKRSIKEAFNSVYSYNFLCGKRDNVKRMREKVVNLLLLILLLELIS